MKKIISKISQRLNQKKAEKGNRPYVSYYEKYSWFPTVISIIALAASMIMPILRKTILLQRI